MNSSCESCEGTQTVLVVDDDPSICEMTGNMLELMGCQVLTAGNAEEALQIFNKRESANLPIDQVWTDIRMPNPRDGINLVYQLANRPSASNMMIVVMSCTTEDATDQDRALIQERHWAFLQKPFDFCQVEELSRAQAE